MSGPLFVTLLVGIPLSLAGLELLEFFVLSRKSRAGRPDEERLRLGTIGFLAAILAVYFAFQFGLFAALPGMKALAALGKTWIDALGPGQVAPSNDELPGLSAGSTLFLVAALFYVTGLADYLMHRYLSHSRWLWFTHEYHHLPKQVNIFMPGIAARPWAVVSTFPVALIAVLVAFFLLRLSGERRLVMGPLQWLVVVQTTVLTASHSAFLRRFARLHRWLTRLGVTTPRDHLLHHAVGLAGNFGNFTTLWDRLLGTYLDPEDARYMGPELGLDYDQDFLGTLTLGRWKFSQAIRDRFQLARFCRCEPAAAPIQSAPEIDPCADRKRSRKKLRGKVRDKGVANTPQRQEEVPTP